MASRGLTLIAPIGMTPAFPERGERTVSTGSANFRSQGAPPSWRLRLLYNKLASRETLPAAAGQLIRKRVRLAQCLCRAPAPEAG